MTRAADFGHPCRRLRELTDALGYTPTRHTTHDAQPSERGTEVSPRGQPHHLTEGLDKAPQGQTDHVRVSSADQSVFRQLEEGARR